MAECRRWTPDHQLDIQQILVDAKTRWLRPSEICEILRNYQRFDLTPDPPYKPPGGSLFLFDRKTLRYFRKDGHNWRKKKDGRTVREAHERLKSGSVDVLHCYYAHGEDENFQRRSYWLLDTQLEHIVLVHYRDLAEGNRSGTPHLLNTDPTTVDSTQGAQTSSAVCMPHLSSAFTTRVSNASSTSTTDWNRPTPSSDFEDADSGREYGQASLADSISSGFQMASLPGCKTVENNAAGYSIFSHIYPSSSTDGTSFTRSANSSNTNQLTSQNIIPDEGRQRICGVFGSAGPFGESSLGPHTEQSNLPEVLGISKIHSDLQGNKISSEQSTCLDGIARKTTHFMSDDCGFTKCVDGESRVFTDKHSNPFLGDGNDQPEVKEENFENQFCPSNENQVRHEHQFYISPQFKFGDGARGDIISVEQPLEYKIEASYVPKKASDALDDGLGGLKKLDSFGRWMNKEIGKDCNDSLMTSDFCNYWDALEAQSNHKEVSSLSSHMQLDVDLLGPSLSKVQLFSILDFSPDWAYSGTETKLLVSGIFLGGIEPSSIKWCCMFGEQEVSAEVLTTNVIRCHTPPHAPGRVPFYITCGNRLACSEVRDFEYRENTASSKLSVAPISNSDEVLIQVRFAKILSLGVEPKPLVCSVENCIKCNLKENLFSLLSGDDREWENIAKDSKILWGCQWNPRDALLQKLLKNMLYKWLVCKVHEEGKGPKALDEKGQGVIHLAAALGYEWAMRPIIAAGVHPSFRDVHGRTALHWAAYFGREETVAALVRLGAAPGAVEDPTSQSPEGQTAADLASSRGYKGIAGYLAEAALTTHLSTLTCNEGIMDSVCATLAAEKAIGIVQGHNNISSSGDDREMLSLRGSLAAVRNSAQAAARIQAALRVQSFRQRQLTRGNDQNHGIVTDALMFSSLNTKTQSKTLRTSHFSDTLHTAAVKIQQKYRGWKGRREFLRIRDRIVRIQAHVRGHQVRKQYKKVVWSVSIVEKAILRWRRKSSGLRGFRSAKAIGGSKEEVGKTDEYEFFRLGRKQKVADVEKALARVQSMVRYPEARDQYMRLVASFDKSKLEDENYNSRHFQQPEDEKKVYEDA